MWCGNGNRMKLEWIVLINFDQNCPFSMLLLYFECMLFNYSLHISDHTDDSCAKNSLKRSTLVHTIHRTYMRAWRARFHNSFWTVSVNWFDSVCRVCKNDDHKSSHVFIWEIGFSFVIATNPIVSRSYFTHLWVAFR